MLNLFLLAHATCSTNSAFVHARMFMIYVWLSRSLSSSHRSLTGNLVTCHLCSDMLTTLLLRDLGNSLHLKELFISCSNSRLATIRGPQIIKGGIYSQNTVYYSRAANNQGVASIRRIQYKDNNTWCEDDNFNESHYTMNDNLPWHAAKPVLTICSLDLCKCLFRYYPRGISISGAKQSG